MSDHLTGRSLTDRVTSAFRWAALAELSSRLAQPLTLIVLARLLVPEDFGVVASATIVVSFSSTLWSSGFSHALVQRAGDPSEVDETSDVVFWSNLLVALIIYAGVFAFSSNLAAIFGDPRVGQVLRVQGLQIVIGALGATHMARHQRGLNFRALYWARVVPAVASGVLAIALAAAGFGFWALTAGAIFGALCQTSVLWATSSWHPRFRFSVERFPKLARFGSWSTAEATLGWAVVWVDVVIVGTLLGPDELGLYRTGAILVTSIFSAVLDPLQPILFSAFSRLQSEPGRLRRAFERTTRLVAAIALPIGVGLAVAGPLIKRVIFGDEWTGIATVIAGIAIVNSISWLIATNRTVYAAVGRPDISAKLMLISLAVYGPALWYASRHGLDVLLPVRVAVAGFSFGLQVIVAHRFIGFGVRGLASTTRSPALAVIVMSGAVGLTYLLPLPDIALLPAVVLVGTASYIAALWVFDRRLVRDIRARLLQRLGSTT